jgi:hypothetical protein
MILAEPKGPAKVLKDLLNTLVTDLIVTRAEAGPEVPPPPSGQVSAEPTATRPEGGGVMARAAEPMSERPSGGAITAMRPPNSAASIREGGSLPEQQATQHDSTPTAQEAAARVTERNAPLRAEQPAALSDQTNTADQSMAKAEPQVARSVDVTGRLAARGTPMRTRRIGRGRAAWYEHPGRTASGATSMRVHRLERPRCHNLAP